MNTERADQAVERAADRLEQTAERFAAEGGVKAKLAETLAEEAAFLRQLKPSLIRARMKGDASTDGGPAAPRSPGIARFGEGETRPKPPGSGGPNPFVVVAAAFAAGMVLAKLIDWRSHAHPRL